MNSKIYVSPQDKSPLLESEGGFTALDGSIFPIIRVGAFSIPNFVDTNDSFDLETYSSIYDHKRSVEFYSNFKEWLFETFGEAEQEFRLKIMKKIIQGDEKRILITGCGLGDDVLPALELTNFNAHVYATDLSSTMLLHTAKTFGKYENNLSFSVCDACKLPFCDNYFDAVFHFGGINLFDNIEQAINEMIRVVSPAGRVGFGDESVAPWLRQLDYGKIAITNNSLWSALPPLDKLPFEAINVKLEWILGNCFYFISFLKNQEGPRMNIDIPHKGIRGGSMRTRYYGVLEGVSTETKERVLYEAKKRNMSISKFTENALQHFFVGES